MRGSGIGRRAAITAGTTAAVAIGAGVAVAAATGIVGSDGVIHGCYATSGGAVRLVAPGASCRSAEHAVAWSQTGPRGATGARGAAGPKGDPGPQGPQGDPGSPAYSLTYDGTDSPLFSPLPPGHYVVSGVIKVVCTAPPSDGAPDGAVASAFVAVISRDQNNGNASSLWDDSTSCPPGTVVALAMPPVQVTVAENEELYVGGALNGDPTVWSAHVVAAPATPLAVNLFR